MYNQVFFTKVVDKGHYKLQFDAYYDQFYGDCMEPQDVKEIINKLDNYDLVCFTAKVSVIVNGLELGNDYLGQCIYETPEEFFNDQDYHADMIEIALNEAREVLNNLQGVTI